jgi:hypothetical protein
MPRQTIRLSVDAGERLQSAVKLRGYANPSTFLRAAMDRELKGRDVFAAERHEPEAEWTITFRQQPPLALLRYRPFIDRVCPFSIDLEA